MSDTRTYYFIYSRMQQDRIDAANKAAGLINPTYGKVVVNGSQKIYTDIVTDMSKTPREIRIRFLTHYLVSKNKMYFPLYHSR